MNVGDVCQRLGRIAPLRLAESWDNVGLLVGDRGATVNRVMTCLTLTPAVVAEAVQRRVDLVVVHHPLPFKPLATITGDTTVGRMLLALIGGGVAVYSAHTAFDSASGGINQSWAIGLGATCIGPLIPKSPVEHVPDVAGPGARPAEDQGVGAGRFATLADAVTLDRLAVLAAEVCGAAEVRVVGGRREIRRVAIACGSGGSFLMAAAACECQAMITGEATFHTCLEAESIGIDLVLVGHFASERFAMVRLADVLRAELLASGIACDIFASDADVNPIRTIAIAQRKD